MRLDFLIDLIFPSVCLGCEKRVSPGETVCKPCFESVPINNTVFCGKCKSRMPSAKRNCHKDFPYVLGAAADYQNETIKNLIYGLKFKFVKKAAEPLSDLLIEYSAKLPLTFRNFTVVPIPLGKKRLRERDFNQAELIARRFASHFALPVSTSALFRKTDTKPQSTISDFESKKANVKDCFYVKNPEEISGRNVILIDDVTTSGSTFLEAASALKKAGARRILALAAAKT